MPRSAIVFLVLLVFVGACASEQITQEGTTEQRRAGEIEQAQPTADPTITDTPGPTAMPLTSAPAPPCVRNEESDNLCEPRDISDFDLFSNRSHHPSDRSSVEEVLEKGLELSGASPVHLAFRGTAQSDTVRCGWRGVVRTLDQPDRRDR